MHGQKKRRKRSLEGVISIERVSLSWRLVSEPQKTSHHEYKGLCLSVQTEDCQHRELILEYPFPNKSTGNGAPQIPQRPRFSVTTLEADVRRAMAAGWEPESRGKPFTYRVPGIGA